MNKRISRRAVDHLHAAYGNRLVYNNIIIGKLVSFRIQYNPVDLLVLVVCDIRVKERFSVFRACHIRKFVQLRNM